MKLADNKWEECYKVHSYLTDRYCRLSIPAVSQLFQETAEGHTSNNGVGYHAMIQENKTWVLLRVFYQINKYPAIYENISFRTWSRGCKGAIALRDFEIRNENKELLIQGTSTWVIIDMESRKPQRCDKMMAIFPQCNEKAIDKELDKMVPVENMETVHTFIVPYTAIDKAQHVNNAIYMRWIMDALFEEDQNRKIKTVNISYIHETKMGETLTIKRYKEGHTYHFSLQNNSDIVLLCDIEMEF